MKSMSAVVEKLHDTGSNVGENFIYTHEDADRIKNQGNVEWTELRQATNAEGA